MKTQSRFSERLLCCPDLDHTAAILGSAAGSVGFEIHMPRYGSGLLSVIKAVLKGGNLVSNRDRAVDPAHISDFSMRAWNDVYTKKRVKELGLNWVRATASAGRDS